MSFLFFDLIQFVNKQWYSVWTVCADCNIKNDIPYHYYDVIMGAMAPQITSLTIVYSTVYSGADQIKHQSSASLVPAQMTSNAKNVSIWWRHHERANFVFDTLVWNNSAALRLWISIPAARRCKPLSQCYYTFHSKDALLLARRLVVSPVM